ncbi:MAG: hypothetical protein WEB37_09670 [Bacteroidota bacterium]
MPEKPNKLRVSLISGVVIGLVSAIPGLNLINCCCCAGIILGGVLAVYLYKQEHVEGAPPMESSDGLILGVTTGVVSAFCTTVLNLLIMALFGDVASEFLRSFTEQILDQANLPPETIDQLRSQIDASMDEAKTFMGVMKELLFNLLIHPLFAMLGGLIGYSIFKPKKPVEFTPTPGA